MKHSPRKRFGQNFLQSQPVINSILQAINPQIGDNLLEIGPGLGALTQPLLKYVARLTAIEIDRDLQEYLSTLPSSQEKLNIIAADALKIDYSQFGTELRIVGNLPYNISTPLLVVLMQYTSYIKDMYFMLQKEVVQRMVATPGTKAYGRFSVLLQYYCDMDYLFTVPPEAFEPQPKVTSAVVRLIPYQTSPYEAVDSRALEQIVACSFAMKRKTLKNNLKDIISEEQLTHLNIDAKKRPEQISVAEYVRMANYINQGGCFVSSSS